jgi:Protein of unknown function (DUF2971)
MTDAKEAASAERSLPPVLQDAINKFNQWSEEHLLLEQEKNTIEMPLYHYTNERGLKGIIESQTIWFTDYRHLNDPSELIHGIEMAHDVMRLAANGADGRVRLFLECLGDMFSSKNFSATLEFFIASFSRERDDLGQWRAYADNGCGYAIGFAPRVFRIVDKSDRKPHENVFVGPVLYGTGEVINRHHLAIDEVAGIFLDTVNANADLVRDKAVGIPFMQDLARAVIASPLIWNSLTSKHPAYAHEREVRLVILGLRNKLMPYITTRLRGSEIVPYIPQPQPLREPHMIAEIVAGPAAGADAERTVRTMLDSFKMEPNIPISRSDIPYRALA